MTITEKMKTVSAAEFGRRIAKAFDESRSSTTLFFMQQAFSDCEDDNGLMWTAFQNMLDRFIAEEEKTNDAN